MRSVTIFNLIAGLMMIASSPAIGATIATDWAGSTGASAYGTLGGVGITATTSSTSPFIGLEHSRFVIGGSGGWDAPASALESTDLALVAAHVNGGDYQLFDFASPLDGMFYIENFDSNSLATITATGATSLTLVTSSPSVSFASNAANSGTLSSTNAGYDGEGDAVLAFQGPVTSVLIDYGAGDGANGVMYTFTKSGLVAASPEPSSALLMLIAGLGMWSLVRRQS